MRESRETNKKIERNDEDIDNYSPGTAALMAVLSGT